MQLRVISFFYTRDGLPTRETWLIGIIRVLHRIVMRVNTKTYNTSYRFIFESRDEKA